MDVDCIHCLQHSFLGIVFTNNNLLIHHIMKAFFIAAGLISIGAISCYFSGFDFDSYMLITIYIFLWQQSLKNKQS